MLNDNVISGQNQLTSGLHSEDELLISDNGTLKRMDISVLTSYNSSLTETLTNKTLTYPKIPDGGYIADANGNQILIFDSNTDAVNEITISNGATTVGPTISASGETNVPLSISSKGTGAISVGADATVKTFNIGTGNAVQTIKIGDHATPENVITIGGAASSVTVGGDITMSGTTLIGGQLATAHASTTNFTVTVAAKTNAHRYYSPGNNGYLIDGIESPVSYTHLTLPTKRIV